MTRAVLLQTGFLGDVVLTTPLVAALARRYGRLDVVTTPSAVPLLETHPAVDRVIPDDKRGTTRGLRGVRAMARALSAGGYDVAYLAHASLRSGVIAWLAGIPRRVGFADAAGRWLYSERVAHSGSHEAERLARLAGAGSRERGADPTRLSIELTDDDRAVAHRALTDAGVESPFVVLAPGSRRATKRWPYYEELARRLAEDVSVVVIGSAEDRHAQAGAWPGSAFRKVRKRAEGCGQGRISREGARLSVSNLMGALALRGTVAVIEPAAVVVTNDSFALHAAQAVGTPVVAIFGPTRPEQGFGPRSTDDQVVELRGLACRPCGTHGHARCPLGHHRCMVAVPVAAVLAAVEETLRAERQPRTTPQPPNGRTASLPSLPWEGGAGSRAAAVPSS